MRKSIIVVTLSVLLMGCFSYKKVDLDQTELKKEDRYKITTVGRNEEKGKFHSEDHRLIILKDRNSHLLEIPKDEIQEVKRRKFSLGRTIALPTGITIGLAGIAIISWSNWSPAIDFN